jgi:hypothetical protein
VAKNQCGDTGHATFLVWSDTRQAACTILRTRRPSPRSEPEHRRDLHGQSAAAKTRTQTVQHFPRKFRSDRRRPSGGGRSSGCGRAPSATSDPRPGSSPVRARFVSHTAAGSPDSHRSITGLRASAKQFKRRRLDVQSQQCRALMR